MMNITAYLLVLTLTGVPVASVACVTECQHTLTTSSHCQPEMATSDGPMVSANESCTDPTIGDSPYVVEYRAVPDAAVLTSTSYPTTPELERTGAPAVTPGAADAGLKAPLVLRI
jgi:hypothetical protein